MEGGVRVCERVCVWRAGVLKREGDPQLHDVISLIV